MMDSFKLEMRAIFVESRSRLSSSAPPTPEHTPQLRTQQIVTSTPLAIKSSTPSPPQLTTPSAVTQQQSNSPVK